MKLYSASTDTAGTRYFTNAAEAVQFVEQSETVNGDLSVVQIPVDTVTMLRVLNGDGGFVKWGALIAVFSAGEWEIMRPAYWPNRK